MEGQELRPERFSNILYMAEATTNSKREFDFDLPVWVEGAFICPCPGPEPVSEKTAVWASRSMEIQMGSKMTGDGKHPPQQVPSLSDSIRGCVESAAGIWPKVSVIKTNGSSI